MDLHIIIVKQVNEALSLISLLCPSIISILAITTCNSSQLILHWRTLSTWVPHGHDLNDQAGPAGKVLCTLSGTRLRVVLLPRKARVFPALVHGVNKIFA